MLEVQVQCFKCLHKWSLNERVSFREECPACGEDAHVCKNCEFYDPGAHNECREPSAELVKDKERANYCDYFQSRGSAEKGKDKDKLLKAAEELFKK